MKRTLLGRGLFGGLLLPGLFFLGGAVAPFGALSGEANGQCSIGELQKIIALSPSSNAHFGSALAVSGDIAILGAYLDDDAGVDAGAVYVYRYDGTDWSLDTKLFASDAFPGDAFGIDVAIDGTTIVVGASNPYLQTNSDRVYVFQNHGFGWTEDAILVANDRAYGDWFGYSVSVSGPVIVVGAWGSDDACPGNPNCRSGSAYVFRHDGVSWNQEDKFTSNDTAAGDLYGLDVAVDGNVALISSHQADTAFANSGAAYIYTYDGVSWAQTQKLIGSNPRPEAGFGRDLDIAGDIAVIGAPFSDIAAPDAGAAYVFHFNGITWAEQDELTASDPSFGGRFGISVAIDNEHLSLGAYQDDTFGAYSGAAYLFELLGGQWEESQKLIASDAASGDRLGLRTALRDDFLFVAAPWDNHGGFVNAGSVYAYPSFSGLQLALDASAYSPGDPIELTTYFGEFLDPVMAVITKVNGVNQFAPIGSGVFGPNFLWSISGNVPSDFSGATIEFTSFGISRCGTGVSTKPVPVVFL